MAATEHAAPKLILNHTNTRSIGVVPRAAGSLFEKLERPPALKRSESSGLRTPTRYSVHSTQGLASMAKTNASADKNWQMKATYVEVSYTADHGACTTEHKLCRSTTSSCEIF